jgi:acyl-CoA thioester hydrolase
VLVKARTTWAMLDKTTGRPQRITTEIIGPFLGKAEA